MNANFYIIIYTLNSKSILELLSLQVDIYGERERERARARARAREREWPLSIYCTNNDYHSKQCIDIGIYFVAIASLYSSFQTTNIPWWTKNCALHIFPFPTCRYTAVDNPPYTPRQRRVSHLFCNKTYFYLVWYWRLQVDLWNIIYILGQMGALEYHRRIRLNEPMSATFKLSLLRFWKDVWGMT